MSLLIDQGGGPVDAAAIRLPGHRALRSRSMSSLIDQGGRLADTVAIGYRGIMLCGADR